MSVLCGYASIDERGKASGGKAGDQTGKEVKTSPWYNFGQTTVLRWKDRSKAATFANIIKSLCNNKYVGYDQSMPDRVSLDTWCKNHGWSYNVNVPVECDCSELIRVAVNCTLKKEAIKISSTFYTGNLETVLMKLGLFTKLTDSKYTKQDAYLMVGDIINNPSKHVITALQNGSKATTTTTKTTTSSGYAKKSVAVIAQEVIAGKWGNGDERKQKLEKAGYNYAEVQKKVNELASPKSATSKKTYQTLYNMNVRSGAKLSASIISSLPKGTKFTSSKQSGNWAYCDSKKGWVCIKDSNKSYLKTV